MMSTFEMARASLLAHEGLRLKPYLCTEGYTTIGVGRNLSTKGISNKESEYLLLNDIHEVIADLETFDFYSRLNNTQQTALIDLRFCVGHSGFRLFKKLLLALQNDDMGEAAAQVLDSKFAQQTGDRAQHVAYLLDPTKGKPWL